MKFSRLVKVITLVVLATVFALPMPAMAAGNAPVKGEISYRYTYPDGCTVDSGATKWSSQRIITNGVEKYSWKSNGVYSIKNVCTGKTIFTGSSRGGGIQILKEGQLVKTTSHYHGRNGDETYKTVFVFTSGKLELQKIWHNNVLIYEYKY